MNITKLQMSPRCHQKHQTPYVLDHPGGQRMSSVQPLWTSETDVASDIQSDPISNQLFGSWFSGKRFESGRVRLTILRWTGLIQLIQLILVTIGKRLKRESVNNFPHLQRPNWPDPWWCLTKLCFRNCHGETTSFTTVHADYSLALPVKVAKMMITVCMMVKGISIPRTTLMRVTLLLLY